MSQANGVLATFSGRNPSQDGWELEQLVEYMRDRNLVRYLEIGARHGDTFHHVVSALNCPLAVAIDLPGGAWGTKSSMHALTRAAADLRRVEGRAVHLVFGDSSDSNVINAVRGLAPFDLVLIDGDHRYDAARRDFDNFRPMSRYVAFHDIAGEGQVTRTSEALPVEVPRLWRELREKYPHREFVSKGSKMGIGVLTGWLP